MFETKADMKFALRKAARVNNGITQMMQELGLKLRSIKRYPYKGLQVGFTSTVLRAGFGCCFVGGYHVRNWY